MFSFFSRHVLTFHLAGRCLHIIDTIFLKGISSLYTVDMYVPNIDNNVLLTIILCVAPA